MSEPRSMYVDLRVGESMTIEGVNGPVVISLTEKSGQRAQLKVLAPPEVRIQRPGSKPQGTGARQAQMGTMLAVPA